MFQAEKKPGALILHKCRALRLLYQFAIVFNFHGVHTCVPVCAHRPLGDGAHPRGRVGGGKNAVHEGAMPPDGGEGVLRESSAEESSVSCQRVHLVVVEGPPHKQHQDNNFLFNKR